MLVISDNSALSSLAEMGLLEVLPEVVGRVTITKAVARECSAAGAPKELRAWIAHPPVWLEIMTDPSVLLEETGALGAGEASAITLAWQNRDNAKLILDEKRGRAVAQALGLKVTGLLGILTEAGGQGLLDFEDALDKLLATGFRLSPALVEDARRTVRDGNPKQAPDA